MDVVDYLNAGLGHIAATEQDRVLLPVSANRIGSCAHLVHVCSDGPGYSEYEFIKSDIGSSGPLLRLCA